MKRNGIAWGRNIKDHKFCLVLVFNKMGHSLLTAGWLEFLRNWNEIKVSLKKKEKILFALKKMQTGKNKE